MRRNLGTGRKSHYNMTVKCDIDPTCEWEGPQRFLVEHKKKAHNVMCRSSFMRRKRRAEKIQSGQAHV